MTEYKIEKNVPLVPKGGNGRNRKYPLPDMNVGDSLFDDSTKTVRGNSMAMTALSWGKKNGKLFTARSVEGGVRVWRIE